MTLKVKFADFRLITRSHTRHEAISTRVAVAAIGADLLRALLPVDVGIRLLGLTLSGLCDTSAAEVQRQETLEF